MVTLCVSAQQPGAVQWQASAKPIGKGVYEVAITAFIRNGWYLYAAGDPQNGLECPKLTWSNAAIATAKSFQLSQAVVIRDPVFNSDQKVFVNGAAFRKDIVVKDSTVSNAELQVHAYASNKEEFIVIDTVLQVDFEGTSANLTASYRLKRSTVDISHPVNNCGEDNSHDQSLFTIFLLGFLGGLLALITPCVFPMIPVTVSFFMNRSPNRSGAVKNGLLYGLFIFLVYVLASVPFHLIKGIDKNVFNSIATNPVVNLAFFIIFVLFSLSFFGLFEISLPGGLATRADSKSGIGSLGGIFFMALTLAIVSFSCTGVILGVLMANVAANGPWALTMGLAGFGLALALPFALFAIFPNLLKRLPKSGSWLETVKKSLAFVELALAFKFLSNADLVEHWGLLKREVFIGIWILISMGLALYLFGPFQKRRAVQPVLQNADRVSEKKAWPKKIMALGMIVFTLLLTPGLTRSKYAGLQWLSGFAPPLSYSIYGEKNSDGKGLEADVINDYDKAVQLAKQQNKPLLIDFTGWACVNCRKMEEQVWSEKAVQEIISDRYILVSLYVDDRKKLPQGKQFTYWAASGEEKQIRTLGDKWATFQAENFNQVTQPLYVVLSPGEKLLNFPVGYTPDAEHYRQWLECGYDAFKKEAAN
jgi:thiol:disulfide interchange protein DsbD